MARVYATPAQYEDYSAREAPANVDALLRLSSRIVDTLLVGVVYDTDTAGMPTDPDVEQQLADATCAIARDSAIVGVLSGGGTSGQWDSISIGNVTLSGRGGESSTAQVSVGGVPVPPDALTALAQVGPLVVMVP